MFSMMFLKTMFFRNIIENHETKMVGRKGEKKQCKYRTRK